MVSRGQIPLQKIWGMLDRCAPGYTRRRKKHHYWVTYKGKTYRALPLGQHGKRNAPIEIGHVRQMVRFLEVDLECARRVLPQLA